MEAEGAPRDDVLDELDRERARDVTFASGRILGSMCTAPHPLAVEAYTRFLETNLGDPVLHPGARELERKASASVLGLLDAPPGALAQFVSGGTEANFTGLRLAARVTNRREVVLPASAHPSFEKAVDILGLTPRVARLTDAWTVDDVPALAELARDVDAHLHVDAAFGGFTIPFLREAGEDVPDFRFHVDGVSSITIDPHKMGMSCIPAGVLAVRDETWMERIAVSVPYVSAARQPTLIGTRPGAAPAAAYAAMRALGRSGYRANAVECLRRARRLAAEVKAAGLDVVREPQLNLVTIRVPEPDETRRRLAEAGFFVAGAPMSKAIKVVVMPHVTNAAVDAFVKALATIVEVA